MITPPARRSTATDTTDGLTIVIPSKRNIFLLFFLSAWLVAWAFAEASTASGLFFGHRQRFDLFTAAWLAMWTVGGGWALYVLLWISVGKEIVRLRPGALGIKRDVLGFGTWREYDAAQIKNLRTAPVPQDAFGMNAGTPAWGLEGGSVKFDYGAKTYGFGLGVDESEARLIVADLTKITRFGG